MKQQMNDQLEQVRKQLEAIVAGAAVTPPKTFAEVARSSPSPQQSIALSLPPGNTAEPTANEFFCMIDTSRVEEQDRGRAQIGSIRQAIENEVRTKEGQVNWKCAAVVRNSRNTKQVKVICRDEIELQRIKEAAQKTAVTGARVMRDQLYPVKVDNVNRTAILDGEGNILQGAAEALQDMGHKASRCSKPQVCGRCAGAGHHHRECHAMDPRCVLCGGPHESFSRNCRVRNIHSNA
ncbi:reverse transcriptase [Hirsutella rhossiliensis]